MCKLNDTLNSELYITILEEELKSTFQFYGLRVEDMLFMQDNATAHTSCQTRECLEREQIRLLKWPAQSPDLNPIENMWHSLEIKLRRLRPAPRNLKELWETIEKEWEATPQQEVQALIQSMPNRIVATIKAKGGYIKY
jgi:transposase